MSRHRRVSFDVLAFDPEIVGKLSAEAEEQLLREPDGDRKLIKALHHAWTASLTPIQRTYMHEYYFNMKPMKHIAAEYGVNIGTISRTITRGKNRLHNALQFYL